MSTHILVRSGEYLDPLNPNENRLHLTDIAHGMSNVCRFSGQPVRFYSVAQHTLLVAALLSVVDPNAFLTREAQLLALFHDASEAYLGDVATPIKQHPAWTTYREYERRLQEVIERKYVLPHARVDLEPFRESVKQADILAFVFEAKHLMGRDYSWMLMPGIALPERKDFKPWSPPRAKRQWLEHHALLLEDASW